MTDPEHDLQNNEGWFASSLVVALAAVFLAILFALCLVGSGAAALVRRIRRW